MLTAKVVNKDLCWSTQSLWLGWLSPTTTADFLNICTTDRVEAIFRVFRGKFVVVAILNQADLVVDAHPCLLWEFQLFLVALQIYFTTNLNPNSRMLFFGGRSLNTLVLFCPQMTQKCSLLHKHVLITSPLPFLYSPAFVKDLHSCSFWIYRMCHHAPPPPPPALGDAGAVVRLELRAANRVVLLRRALGWC